MKRSTSKGLSASPVAVVLVVWWFVFSPASFLRREMKRSTSKGLSASPVFSPVSFSEVQMHYTFFPILASSF